MKDIFPDPTIMLEGCCNNAISVDFNHHIFAAGAFSEKRLRVMLVRRTEPFH